MRSHRATNQDATGEMKPSVETMIPVYLKQQGYISSMVGKWGQLPLTPEEWGFDDTFRFRVAVFTGTRPTKRFRIGLTEQSIIFKMANTCLT